MLEVDDDMRHDQVFFMGVFAGWHMLLAGAGLMMCDGWLVAYATAATALFTCAAFKRRQS